MVSSVQSIEHMFLSKCSTAPRLRQGARRSPLVSGKEASAALVDEVQGQKEGCVRSVRTNAHKSGGERVVLWVSVCIMWITVGRGGDKWGDRWISRAVSGRSR